MAKPLDNLEHIKMISKEGHQVYLDNWETKTLVAENNGEWNSDIQHRVLTSIENLASTIDVLCFALERIIEMNELKTIDP